MTLPELKPMKMTDVPVISAALYLDDDDWIMEQKHDGARAMVSWDETEGAFHWQASGGGPLKFAAAAQHLKNVERDLLALIDASDVRAMVLDGELMTEEGIYRVFDVPYLVQDSLESDEPLERDWTRELVSRLLTRSMLFDGLALEHVVQVYTAFTSEQKRELWEGINAQGVEGGMVKHLKASYEPGVRTKMQRKLKLVKTVDVIVTSVERRFDHKGMVTHGSAGLAVRMQPAQDPRPFQSKVTGKRKTHDEIEEMRQSTKAQRARALAFAFLPRTELPVGAASLIGKDLSIDIGDVVEVNYLYWGGDALVQPRIVRKRLADEKLADDCRIDQIPAYSRAEVRF